jgi:RND family efflux transporter MFP subunit
MNATCSKSTIAGWMLLSAAMVTLTGCGGQAPAQGSGGPKPTEVTVVNPTQKTVIDYAEFTGRIDAVNKVAVQAMVGGYLTRVNFIDGDDVRENQVLFNIDPRTYQATLNLAKAAQDQAEAHYQRLNFDFDRGQRMLKDRAMSREDFDKVAGDRLEALAAVSQSKAQVEQADLNVTYTKVESPMNGRISRRLMDVGNMIKANETILTWVYQIDPMYGYFDVDEQTMIKLRKLINDGSLRSFREGIANADARIRVEVGLADEKGFSIKSAYVDWVDNVLDPGTGTLKVRCVIDQPRDKAGKAQVLLSPNMFVRMRLPISNPRPALLIPERAVGTDQGDKFVYVLNQDNKIEQVKIKLGQMHDGLRVVEKAGARDLLATDWILIDNLQRVRPGPDQPSVVARKSPGASAP